jgi:hypothetical protein
MNEYQDQNTWYEVQRKINSRWQTVSDHDTEDRARIAMCASRSIDDQHDYRVKRVRGL